MTQAQVTNLRKADNSAPTGYADHRAILNAAIRAVIDGKLNVQRANAVAALSSEVHKNIRLEMVGVALSDRAMAIENGKLVQISSDG